MARGITILVSLVTLVGLSLGDSWAAIVTYQATGHVTSVSNSTGMSSPFAVGDQFVSILSYDTAPIGGSDGSYGVAYDNVFVQNPNTNYWFSFHGQQTTPVDPKDIHVTDQSPSPSSHDEVNFWAVNYASQSNHSSSATVPSNYFYSVNWVLSDAGGTALSSTDIPDNLMGLSNSRIFYMDYTTVSGTHPYSVTGTIDGLVRIDSAVPEPAALVIWSLFGGASWLGMIVWRRRKQYQGV
jgi:hypothetical protein